MKLLQGAVQASGYRVVHLVDPEDLGLLHFEETGEMPEGLDFAILWNGVWREGRCYDSYPYRTFVTYGDAQRLPLWAGMTARLPHYELGQDRLLELASIYASELGYTCIQGCTIVGEETSIEAGDYTHVAVHLGNGKSPLEITIKLYSSGDIRLIADTEVFLTTYPLDSEGIDE